MITLNKEEVKEVEEGKDHPRAIQEVGRSCHLPLELIFFATMVQLTNLRILSES